RRRTHAAGRLGTLGYRRRVRAPARRPGRLAAALVWDLPRLWTGKQARLRAPRAPGGRPRRVSRIVRFRPADAAGVGARAELPVPERRALPRDLPRRSAVSDRVHRSRRVPDLRLVGATVRHSGWHGLAVRVVLDAAGAGPWRARDLRHALRG